MRNIAAHKRFSCSRLIGASLLCLGLAAAPVTFDSGRLDVEPKAAAAKKGGDKGGGKGGGKDRGGRDRGGKDKSSGKSNSSGNSGKSSVGAANGSRGGNAFGKEQKDRRIEQAKDRYGKTQKKAGRSSKVSIASDPDSKRVAHRFSKAQTDDLIGGGWKTDKSVDGFVNHGDRVRTMVKLAKALGYDASVGALQANFGTPSENGIAALQDELAVARGEAEIDPEAASKVADLEAELALAIENAKPGQGPVSDWAVADLDVNDDGIVDRTDLAALGDLRDEDDIPSDDGDEDRDDDDKQGDDDEQGEDEDGDDD